MNHTLACYRCVLCAFLLRWRFGIYWMCRPLKVIAESNWKHAFKVDNSGKQSFVSGIPSSISTCI
jgi:hypothetical protein